MDTITFQLDKPITLQQLLKATDLVGSGGEAKLLVQSGAVRLNNTICTQRGKQIQIGDTVLLEVQGAKHRIEVIG